MEMDSRFHVGDKVRIITDRLAPEEMDRLAGTKHEIKTVQWCDLCGRYEYRVKDDVLLWCDDDFEFDVQTDLPEFCASEFSLDELLG